MAGLKRIHTFAVGLTADEQKGAFAMIDDYALRGMQAAADNAKRVILGPSPADRKLGVWLRADEAVVIELLDIAFLRTPSRSASRSRVPSRVRAPTRDGDGAPRGSN